MLNDRIMEKKKNLLVCSYFIIMQLFYYHAVNWI